MQELAERTAIVVGGAGGIGAAVSRVLARQGARVIIGDADLGAMNACAEQLRGRASRPRSCRLMSSPKKRSITSIGAWLT